MFNLCGGDIISADMELMAHKSLTFKPAESFQVPHLALEPRVCHAA